MKDWGNPNSYNENQDSLSGPMRPRPPRPLNLSGPPQPVTWWETMPGILMNLLIRSAIIGGIIWLIVK